MRLAIVGTAAGRSMLNEWLAVDGVRITALCDIAPEKAALAAKMVTDAGQPAPAIYTRGERDFERLMQRDDVDIVYTATPWGWHVPVCLAAMNAGKHAATEVPAATTFEDVAAGDYIGGDPPTLPDDGKLCYDFNEMLLTRW